MRRQLGGFKPVSKSPHEAEFVGTDKETTAFWGMGVGVEVEVGVRLAGMTGTEGDGGEVY